MSIQPNDWLMDGGAIAAPHIAPDMVRGKLTANAPLAPLVWFKAGGAADWLFEPADLADLIEFLGLVNGTMPLMALGLGSNLIVRDGGVPGIVVRLGKALNSFFDGNHSEFFLHQSPGPSACRDFHFAGWGYGGVSV